MRQKNVWVIGFDKNTGGYKDFCCCPKQDAKFYKGLYEGKGLMVEVMTREELSDFLGQNNS